MATFQNKRANTIDAINKAALKAGEIAFVVAGDDKGRGYLGIDGVAGTAVPFVAGAADEAKKLSTAHSFSATGDVTATAVDFDGTGDVALNVSINAKAVDESKLSDSVNASLDLADSALQKADITEGATNGTIAVEGTDVAVHGLQDAAYETVANLHKYADDADAVLKAAVVNTLAAADASVTVAGTVTDKTVGVKLDPAADNAIKLGTDGLKVTLPDAVEYTIVKDADAGDYAAIYHLTKDGENVGASINIPKDMVVKSGEVVTNPEGQPEGTYLVLTLANTTSDKIYINVSDLIEYVTSGSKTGDMVVIAVSDDHKVTATITDGTINKEKLTVAVQTSLGLADTALQAADIAEGSANGTISVEGTDVSVHGLGDAAYTTVAALNEYADNTATTKVAALKGTDADATTAITVYGARALAQKGVDDAAAALAKAEEKVASVTAADGTITVGGTDVAPTVKVAVSAVDGNAVVAKDDGIYVATPESMAAGNGISIANNTVSAKVVAANGLSVDADGIKMGLATAAVAGAVKASDEITVTNGVLGFGDVDLGTLD